MIKSAEEFVKLRESVKPEEYLRSAKDEAPIVVWYEVIRKFPDMKEWVVHNKTVPIEILCLLSEDPNPLVRSSVADKRKCPADILAKLAKDSDDGVRLRVAYNPKVTREILKTLTTDSWDEIVRVSKNRLVPDPD
jgi:hypothetical protein